MKKICLIMFTMIAIAMNVNAQSAVQESKFFDNWSIGIEGGVTTPLDFNSVFPLNAVAGLKIAKEFTPVVGVEAEGLVWFNDNHFPYQPKTFVKATNVGLNATLNLTNWFCGYKGAPRFFEVRTNTGLGWLHYWQKQAPTPDVTVVTEDGMAFVEAPELPNRNLLTAKTGLDFNFNFGAVKQHTFSVSPAVFWSLNNTGKVKFNKHNAQLGVMVGYTYHFKTSNGTHHFKLYDIAGLNEEINRLRNQPERVVTHVVEKTKLEVQPVATEWVVEFAQNSFDIDATAKAKLNEIPQGTKVNVEGSASPEGSANYNQRLSENRANAVAEFLRNNGVDVQNVTGCGAERDASNRLVRVTLAQ